MFRSSRLYAWCRPEPECDVQLFVAGDSRAKRASAASDPVMVDRALAEMSPLFDQMYSEMGRPSIPPEKLLRAQLLQMLYSVRSERLLMEEIDYSVLFRWFVGMNMDEPVWDPTVFTKNRDRLLKHEVAKVFFVQVWNQAEQANLTSDEHFTVDGTLLEACASLKSFQKKGTRKHDDPDDPAECRQINVTPHVSQNTNRAGGSAIDGRTTRHAGYTISQRKRKRIEECFGWLKTVALLRKLRHRGIFKVGWVFTFAATA